MVELVILEGPDGAGKTTLYEKHFKPLGFEFFHHGVYDTPLDAYKAYREEQEAIRHRDKVVLDRCHISQAVYGPMYRAEPHFRVHHNVVDGVYFQMKAVVVLCNTKEAIHNWRKRKGDEYIQSEGPYQLVHQKYELDNVRKLTTLAIVEYDYTDTVVNELHPIENRVELMRETFYDDTYL